MNSETLFRALSSYDEENYNTKGEIKSLLFKPVTSKKRLEKKQEYYNLCIEGNGEYALDTVVGHVQGRKLQVETSCWISTTSNFDLACSEYAIPQSGNYNHFDNRKNVVRIEVEKSKILSDNEKIKELRNTNMPDEVFIDLRDGKLNSYYNNSILSETFNPDMPGYDWFKDATKYVFGTKTSVDGFSNYATASKEVLAYKEIKSELIKSLYVPLQQDILYGSNTIMDLDIEWLEYAYQKLPSEQKEFFKLLYPTITTGANLTDILLQNYKLIEGMNIYEKYETLKKQKIEMLSILTNIINDKSRESKLNIQRVVDNGILVYSLDMPYELSKSSINDVIIIQLAGELYKYNHKDKAYVNEQGKVLKKEILIKNNCTKSK